MYSTGVSSLISTGSCWEQSKQTPLSVSWEHNIHLDPMAVSHQLKYLDHTGSYHNIYYLVPMKCTASIIKLSILMKESNITCNFIDHDMDSYFERTVSTLAALHQDQSIFLIKDVLVVIVLPTLHVLLPPGLPLNMDKWHDTRPSVL